MIRAGTLSDLPQIRELFRRANESPYELDRVLEEKLFGPGFDGPPEVRLYENDGSVSGVSVVCGKYLRLIAVDRDSRRRGIGSQLIGNARIIGAEPGNYFTPGIVDSDAATIGFARARGFRETAATWNLEVNVGAGFSQPIGHRSGSPTGRLKPAPGLRRVTRHDRERFLSFVLREFGGRWRFEAARAFESVEPTAFWIEDVGFAVHEANNRGLGTFGPTGVAKTHRNRGHGRNLLLASLADLQRLGYTKVTIPWTDAIDFYRKTCGAEPAHRFVAFAK